MTTETKVVATEEERAKEVQDAAAGFAEVFDDKPAAKTDKDATQAPAPTSEKSDAEKAAAKVEADKTATAKAEADAKVAAEKEWEVVPKVVRDRLQSLEALPNRLRNIEGHIGGLKSSLDSVLATAKAAATSKGADTPTDKQVQAALSNPEAWKQIKADFPEWAGPVEAEFAALRAEIAKQPKAQAVDVDGLRKEMAGSMGLGLAQAEERAFLRLKHPNWKTEINSQECKAWMLEGGPSAESFQKYKELEQTDPQKAKDVVHGFAQAHPQWWADRGAFIFSDSADDAAKLLDGYAVRKKQSADAEATRLKREKRLEGAITPKGTSSARDPALGDRDAAQKAFSEQFS